MKEDKKSGSGGSVKDEDIAVALSLTRADVESIQHDIRNALSSIELAMYHLKNEVPDGDAVKHLFEIIQRSSLLIKDIANNRLK